MPRNRVSVCRFCRVERTKLFLKGNKCLTEKCPVERRPYAPGEHGRARRRILGYGIQLREKQKLKRYYGMSERQFRLFFENLVCLGTTYTKDISQSNFNSFF